MEYRKLGKTDLNVSVMTLGAWQYGCEKYWGEVARKDIEKVIHTAISRGINTIDTAIGYDDSELIVGDAIKGHRDELVMITKGGADPEKMEKWIDLSLKRLGLDYLDLYLVHYPDFDIPIEDTIEGMVELQKKGKTRFIGVSNFNAEQLSRAAEVANIACNQSAYNIMWKEVEDEGIVDVCVNNSIGILCYSPLGQGILTGKIRSSEDLPTREGDIRQLTVLYKGEAFEKGLELLKLMDGMAQKHNKSLAQVAINWVINQKGVTSAIVGSKNIGQLEDNLGSVGWKMEEKDYRELSEKGSQISSLFDYSKSIFGITYADVKIDQMIEESSPQ